MPELPEVEVVRAGLEPWVTGRTVESVEVLDRRSLRRHEGPFEHLLQGATLTSAVRRGKFLWFGLGEDTALVAHLGMSGQILLDDETAPVKRHTRLVFTFSDSRGDASRHRHNQMRFVDQRIFGGFHIQPLVPTADGGPGGYGDATPLIPPAAAHIARDPLDPLFDPDAVVARMRRRRTDVKRALLDQGLVSGIGNIYADEALFRARVHYLAPTYTTRPSRLRGVLDAAEEVMREALAQGGTSFDALYINVNGESGYFERRLDVYGRAGLPCRVCGTTIVRETFMNRGSHFCPVCQKRPRHPRA